jgi:hypothetical protein
MGYSPGHVTGPRGPPTWGGGQGPPRKSAARFCPFGSVAFCVRTHATSHAGGIHARAAVSVRRPARLPCCIDPLPRPLDVTPLVRRCQMGGRKRSERRRRTRAANGGGATQNHQSRFPIGEMWRLHGRGCRNLIVCNLLDLEILINSGRLIESKRVT